MTDKVSNMQPNWTNRTLFHHDNLAVLRGMNSGTVHLIATDPPFNKGRDFHALPDSLADGAAFQDRWSWARDVHQEWVDRIEDDWPKVKHVIAGSRASYGDDMGAFLSFMGVRLLEMRRVLRDDGSIYLHCDPTAGAYLKELMDAIFGRENFRNEIVWCYPPKGRGPKYGFHNKHDIILFYAKSPSAPFFRPYTSLTDKAKAKFSKTDSDGRRYKEFKRKRTYLDESQGRPVPDWWDDIAQTAQSRIEYIGYPTQKPLKLYRRIIEASSREGDIVLDPFCGCATTPVAAEHLGRQWVGIDIWARAHEIVIRRLQQEGLLADHRGRNGETGGGQSLLAFDRIKYATSPPERTDGGREAVPFLRTRLRVDEPKGPRMSRKEMKEILLSPHGPKCAGCDRLFDDERYLELDHNTPRSDGGINHISNRILLCGPCNKLKSNTRTLSGLRLENRKQGYMAR